MRKINTDLIYKHAYSLITEACLNITKDGQLLLDNALKQETNCNAKFALDILKENIDVANGLKIPPCQDTGMAVFFLEIGQDIAFVGEYLIDVINTAVKNAYTDNCFRMSVLDPLTRRNTLDNTPAIIHTEIIKGDKVVMTFMPKGFGSENMSKLYMLPPSAGIESVKQVVIDTVSFSGSNPCPPIVVGVGIGGTSEKACLLAKKALLRDLTADNSDKELNDLEVELLKKINNLGIGVQGFGGNNTALKVSILKYPTHISALPVAVNVQCHAIRLASVTI